jgi:CubicO group peptidase (beta-lactamase class C family)
MQVVAQPREFVNGWGTGSVVSSGSGMAAYLKTLIARGVTPDGDRILGGSTRRQMTTPQIHLPLSAWLLARGEATPSSRLEKR